MSNLVTLAAPGTRRPSILPVLARTATVIGALVSLGCMFYTGQHNRSIVLVALFAAWVLSPFLGLLWARRFAYWHHFAAQAMVYALIFVVALGSAAAYAFAAFGPHWTRPALPFLATPLLSWFLIGGVVLVVRLCFGGRPTLVRR